MALKQLSDSITQEQLSKLINLSGRQRMLSQRIALLILHYGKHNTSEILSQLDSAIALFEKSHYQLIEGDDDEDLPGVFSDSLHKLYFSKDAHADETIKDFISQVRKIRINIDLESDRLDQAVNQVLDLATTSLLDILNEITLVYQAEAKSLSDRSIQHIERNMRQIESLLDNITSISRQAKIIAFNTAVAASRLGENGAEITVVAREIERLTNNINTEVKHVKQRLEI